MKRIFTGLTLLITFSVFSSSTLSQSEMLLTFTKSSKTLFESGEEQYKLIIKKNVHRTPLGNVEIIAPYKQSIINENLSCFKLQMSAGDDLQSVFHRIPRPTSRYCEAIINIRKQ